MDLNIGYVLLGCFGGVIPDLLRFVTNKKNILEPKTEASPDAAQPANPSNNKTILLGTLAQIVLGGLAVIVMGNSIKDYKYALFAGFFGSEIITALSAVFKNTLDKLLENIKGREPLGFDGVRSPRVKNLENLNYLLSWWHM